MDPIEEPVEFTHQGQVYECYVRDGSLCVVCKETQELVIKKPYYDSEIEYIDCHPNHLILSGKWACVHYITYDKLFSGGDFYHCTKYDHVYFDGETVHVGYRDILGTTTYPRDVFFTDPESILQKCRQAYLSPMWDESRRLILAKPVLFDELCKHTPYEGVIYEGETVSDFGNLISFTLTGLSSGQDYTGEYNPCDHLIAMLREPIPQPIREGCHKRTGFVEVTEFQKILFYMITGSSWDEFCAVSAWGDEFCTDGAQTNSSSDISFRINLLFKFVFSNKTVLITIKSRLVLGDEPRFGKHYYMDRSIPVHVKIEVQ